MSSAQGFPDWQRITSWLGSALVQATGLLIGAGNHVDGPLQASNFASVVVCIKPTGGPVTVTVTQSVPGGPASLVTSSSFTVNAGNVIFEAFVLLGGLVTVTFQGSVAGTTIDYAIVPSNTNTNAEVAALTQLGFQLNDVLSANETAIDLLDTTTLLWTLLNDPANQRMKVSAMHRAIAAKAIRSSNQAIATGVDVPISFDGVYIDSDTMWAAGSPTRLTCKVAGTYLTGFNAIFAGSAAGTFRDAKVRLNGATNVARDTKGPSANQFILGASNLVALVVGDYLELVAGQDTGGNLNVVTDPQYSPSLFAVRQ